MTEQRNKIYEGITWQEATRMKRKYGGWSSLARAIPEFAYQAYRQIGIADLGRAFVQEYAGSRKAGLQGKAHEVSRDLKNLRKPKQLTFSVIGTLGPDVFGNVDLNWRNSNCWDSRIRELEEAS